jgi:hypothetical protein
MKYASQAILAFVLLLAGCAVKPSLGRQRYAQNALLRQQVVEVDFEAATPQRAEQLRQSGVQLPRVSAGGADPRAHRDFVDLRVTAVGYGITAGGYLLYCEGLPLPVLVPESHVDLGLTNAEPLSTSIHPDRDSALAEMAVDAASSRHARYAWYRGAGGVLIVPTLFSPATTPRIARTMLVVRAHLSESVQRELKVLLLTLTGTKVLQGVFARVVRTSAEPELQPRQPTPRPTAPTSAPAPESAPGRVAPAPPPTTPAPSPTLVQALTGNNPTPSVATGPRLLQDVAVNPKVPRLRETQRPIGSSPSQNAQVQADIQYLRSMGARNIRVNQQQVTAEDVQRVGTNRPDLQFDYNGRRYHVEYDTPTSGRGPSHQSRITSNDADAEIILLIVP